VAGCARTIEFDPRKEQITDNPDANALLRRKYRALFA
jgi:hypothetical protein